MQRMDIQFQSNQSLFLYSMRRMKRLRRSTAVIFKAILNETPTAATRLNPSLPSKLESVINNCLQKDRELRYPSAAAVRDDCCSSSGPRSPAKGVSDGKPSVLELRYW